MASSVEIERKYEVPEGAVLPIPEGFRGDPLVTVELSAVYWDTGDAALARAAVALRRRTGGHDAGWHLKLPARLGREEVVAPLSDAVPAELLDRVETLLQGRSLGELARVQTRRTILVLRDAESSAVVELADDDVVATDVRAGVERRWREWEAEILPGVVDADAERAAERAAGLLDAVEVGLRAAGATPSSSGSKLARALGYERLGDGLGPAGTGPVSPPA